LDKEIQEGEKKRWEAEKQIEDADAKISRVDKSSDQLVTEKNGLRDKILGIDKSLRDIYTVVIAREEEKRAGMAQEQIANREALAKAKSEQMEKVQRQQWSGAVPQRPAQGDGYLNKSPISLKSNNPTLPPIPQKK
jgi:predicted RNA-binding protein with PUA domain